MSTSCSAKNLSQSAALCSCSSWSHSERLLNSRFDYPVPMLPAPACSRECNRGQSEARPDDTRQSLIEILEISKDSFNGVKSIDFRSSRNHGNRSTQASIKFLLVGPRNIYFCYILRLLILLTYRNLICLCFIRCIHCRRILHVAILRANRLTDGLYISR